MAAKLSAKSRARRLRSLLNRDGDLCHYCKVLLVDGKNLTFDHVITRMNGGQNAMTNLVLACNDCNNSRGNMRYGKFLRKMQIALQTEPFVRPVAKRPRPRPKVLVQQPFNDLMKDWNNCGV